MRPFFPRRRRWYWSLPVLLVAAGLWYFAYRAAHLPADAGPPPSR
jgi:hypothetical protein